MAVDMAAAERRIHSALQAHVSQLRQQLQAEQQEQMTAEIRQQVSCGAFPDCPVSNVL